MGREDRDEIIPADRQLSPESREAEQTCLENFPTSILPRVQHNEILREENRTSHSARDSTLNEKNTTIRPLSRKHASQLLSPGPRRSPPALYFDFTTTFPLHLEQTPQYDTPKDSSPAQESTLTTTRTSPSTSPSFRLRIRSPLQPPTSAHPHKHRTQHLRPAALRPLNNRYPLPRQLHRCLRLFPLSPSMGASRNNWHDVRV